MCVALSDLDSILILGETSLLAHDRIDESISKGVGERLVLVLGNHFFVGVVGVDLVHLDIVVPLQIS